MSNLKKENSENGFSVEFNLDLMNFVEYLSEKYNIDHEKEWEEFNK